MSQYMIYRRSRAQDVVWDQAIRIWGEEVRIRTGRAGEGTKPHAADPQRLREQGPLA